MNLPLVAATFVTRRFTLTQSTGMFTQIVPRNPSRWSVTFLSRIPSTGFVTCFPGNADCPGEAFQAGVPIKWVADKHPGLVGLAWYITTFDPIVPPSVYEAWEEATV